MNEAMTISQSEKITDIVKALLNVQKKMQPVKMGATNPYFKSKYATLNDCLESVIPLLNENGIIILQPLSYDDTSNPVVSTLLIHESGQWIKGSMKVPMKSNDPQQAGSSVTYGRRYCLKSLLSMQDIDDDGEEAMGRGEYAEKQAAKTANKPKDNKPSNELVTEMFKLLGKEGLGYDGKQIAAICKKVCGRTIGSSAEMTDNEVSRIIEEAKRQLQTRG